jgi:hypothetical protein
MPVARAPGYIHRGRDSIVAGASRQKFRMQEEHEAIGRQD